MISSRHRFHGYNALKILYRYGQTVRGPLFSIKSRPNPRRRSYRLAVVVSRRVNKSAVTRNRIRRRLYEAVRLMEKDIDGPHDIVITVFHDTVADEDIKNLTRQIKNSFKQAGILKKPA